MYIFSLAGMAFPVAPEKMETKINGRNKTVELVDDREINIVKEPGLTEYSMTVLLPNSRYDFAYYPTDFQKAKTYLDWLEQLALGKQPFQMTLYRALPNGEPLGYTNARVTLEDYSITEDATQGYDMEVKISLKEWQPYGVGLTSLDSERYGAPVTPATYTVQRGDTLYNIAHKIYGDGSRYKELALNNNLADPNIIEPGQVIVLA